MRGNEARKHVEARPQIEVVERRDAPGAWTVEEIDVEGDGAIHQAIFAGPEAEARAIEYAQWRYN